MIKVLEAAGPGDAELEDQVPGYPSEETVNDALKNRRKVLAPFLAEERARLQRKYGNSSGSLTDDVE